MKRPVQLLSLLFILVLAAACSPAAATPTPQPSATEPTLSTAATAEPTEPPTVAPTPIPEGPKGELVVAIQKGEGGCWSPYHCGGMYLQDLIIERLVRWDRDMQLAPMLATSWELVDDTTWEFKLREGVFFTNGEPFNAETVKFNFDPIVEGAEVVHPTVKANFRSIIAVEIVDEYTVRFITDNPDPLIPNYLAYEPRMMPPEHYTAVGDEGFSLDPIGTGPFRMVEEVKGEYLIVDANPDYWGQVSPVQRVTFRPIVEDTTRVAELLAEGVDIAEGIPADLISQVEQSGDATVEIVPKTTVTYVHLRPRDRLTNLALREAFMYATDTELLIETVMGGMGGKLRRGACLTPWEFGYDESIPEWPYDPEMAKKKLEEAGYDGHEIVFTYRIGLIPQADQLAEALQAMWAEVGLNVTINREESGVWSQNWKIPDPTGDIFMSNTAAKAMDSDARLTPSVHCFDAERSMGRVSFFCDPEIDKLIDGARMEMDREKRFAMLSEAWRLHRDAAHHMPLFYQMFAYGVSNEIEWHPAIDHMWSDLIYLTSK